MNARDRWAINSVIGGLALARECLLKAAMLDKLTPESRRRCGAAADLCDELIGEIRRAYFAKYGAPK